jgi:hypothetical protein
MKQPEEGLEPSRSAMKDLILQIKGRLKSGRVPGEDLKKAVSLVKGNNQEKMVGIQRAQKDLSLALLNSASTRPAFEKETTALADYLQGIHSVQDLVSESSAANVVAYLSFIEDCTKTQVGVPPLKSPTHELNTTYTTESLQSRAELLERVLKALNQNVFGLADCDILTSHLEQAVSLHRLACIFGAKAQVSKDFALSNGLVSLMNGLKGLTSTTFRESLWRMSRIILATQQIW